MRYKEEGGVVSHASEGKEWQGLHSRGFGPPWPSRQRTASRSQDQARPAQFSEPGVAPVLPTLEPSFEERGPRLCSLP